MLTVKNKDMGYIFSIIRWVVIIYLLLLLIPGLTWVALQSYNYADTADENILFLDNMRSHTQQHEVNPVNRIKTGEEYEPKPDDMLVARYGRWGLLPYAVPDEADIDWRRYSILPSSEDSVKPDSVKDIYNNPKLPKRK